MSANDIEPVPAPWKLKGTVYSLIFSATKEQIDQATAAGLTYSPLEAASAYADPAGSKPVGGLSMINIIRYTESPAGPYDELILTPGFHEYTVEEDGRRVTKKNTRVTRIYVSQKYTCWNGRKSEHACCAPEEPS